MLVLSPSIYLSDFGSFLMKIPVVIQRKIFEFLTQGNTHRQIAKRVNVSPTTVGVIAKKLNEIQMPVAEVLKASNQEFVDIVQTVLQKILRSANRFQILHISMIK